MRNALLKLRIRAQIAVQALKDESAQDLIEYALIVALVAFAATAGMNSLAAGINTAFTNIANTLGAYIT